MVDQNIRGLDVSMDHISRMEVFYTAKNIVQNHFKVSLLKGEVRWLLSLEELSQILLEVIHNQKKCVILE